MLMVATSSRSPLAPSQKTYFKTRVFSAVVLPCVVFIEVVL
ncbi:MAG: hypothetical protein QW503_03550 [Sulfolobales archaeon]